MAYKNIICLSAWNLHLCIIKKHRYFLQLNCYNDITIASVGSVSQYHTDSIPIQNALIGSNFDLKMHTIPSYLVTWIIKQEVARIFFFKPCHCDSLYYIHQSSGISSVKHRLDMFIIPVVNCLHSVYLILELTLKVPPPLHSFTFQKLLSHPAKIL